MSRGASRPGLFSPTVMEHFLHPRNVGTLAAPTGEGWSGSRESGRLVRIQVRLRDGVVQEARYQTYGCAPAIAAGSFLTEWVQGRTVQEALELGPEELERQLGGLPPQRRFCAALAVDALRQALSSSSQEACP